MIQVLPGQSWEKANKLVNFSRINWGPQSESIQCLIRIRPLLEGETAEQGHTQSNLSWKENQISLRWPERGGVVKTTTYAFNTVLGPEAEQYAVFEAAGIRSMVSRVIEGFNATCISYGQTSSGKTYTMEGFSYGRTKRGIYAPRFMDMNPAQYGLSINAIYSLFDQIDNRPPKHEVIRTKVSFCQIYQDIPYDLLSPASKSKMIPLKIRWRHDFFVQNLYTYEITSPEEAIEYLQMGIKRRVLASHQLNKASSRSHCLYTLTVERVVNNTTIISKLVLVDLAGSERMSHTGYDKELTFKEAVKINRSLMVLRNCVDILAAGKTTLHVPYRDSTLTKLLKSSLGGNSLTLLVACVVPSDKYCTENANTLRYAAKASKVYNSPAINEDPRDTLIRKLKTEIKSLKTQLARVKLVVRDNVGLGAYTESPSPTFFDVNLVDKKVTRKEKKLSDLVKDNNTLRKMLASGVDEKSHFESENYVLNTENYVLRDTIRKLESAGVRTSDTMSTVVTTKPQIKCRSTNKPHSGYAWKPKVDESPVSYLESPEYLGTCLPLNPKSCLPRNIARAPEKSRLLWTSFFVNRGKFASSKVEDQDLSSNVSKIVKQVNISRETTKNHDFSNNLTTAELPSRLDKTIPSKGIDSSNVTTEELQNRSNLTTEELSSRLDKTIPNKGIDSSNVTTEELQNRNNLTTEELSSRLDKTIPNKGIDSSNVTTEELQNRSHLTTEELPSRLDKNIPNKGIDSSNVTTEELQISSTTSKCELDNWAKQFDENFDATSSSSDDDF